MKTFIIRQGDVLVRRVSEIPADAKPLDAEGVATLALGEATGRHHSIVSEKVKTFGTGRDTLCSFFQADEPVSLTHQEHTALEIPPASYQVVRQRTYATGMARRVED